jgi:hypothetical protein
MNIRVDLNTPINDGTEVVFRSPVDCSQVTGLKVYYQGNSKEFAFADAHGNNVGDIDHLFAENVVVKVILDVTHGMAFVQNADTNAYLEGRFADIIDKLCPTINETGLLVQCSPLEGYPLEVQAKESGDIGGVTVTVCGKNLYDANTYPMTPKKMIRHASGTYADSTGFSATEAYIPAAHLQGKTISIRNAPKVTNPTGTTNAGIAFYDKAKNYLSGTHQAQITVPENAVYMRFCINTDYLEYGVQIEIGEKVTDYEEYSANIFTSEGDAASEFIHVKTIDDRSGLTTVFAYMGLAENLGELTTATEVKVFGRADPNAKIRRLTDDIAELKAAMLTMGANV